MQPRRFFIACVLAAATGLGAVAVVNYMVDVNGIYHTRGLQKYVAEYVQRMTASPFGVGQITYERAVKIELARFTSADCYVTGSSKEMGIALDHVPTLKTQCSSLINLGESGGSYEDAVTLLAIVVAKKAKSVFIGIGPWFFLFNADRRWTEFASEYQEARAFFGLKPVSNSIQAEKGMNLINGVYFARNLEALFKRKGNKLPPIVEALADGSNLADDDAIYRPDGSLAYSRTFLAYAKIQDAAECRDYRVKSPFTSLAVIQEFEHVVQRMRAKGINVTLVLMPYHPGVFRCSGLTVPATEKTERAVKEISANLNIPVIGSYDPNKFRLKAADFYDFMHVRMESLDKVIR
jgi:hypothetical protein